LRKQDEDGALALRMQARRCHNRLGSGVWMLQLQSAFGVFALLAIAWAFGEDRSSVSPRQAATGLFVTLLNQINNDSSLMKPLCYSGTNDRE